ncbi:MAG: hypothetical protein IRY90_20435, partial [Actinomadura rubrobrunea]|nr:hypothetical protein [Actinomadura rubrobrunea]
DRDRPGLDGPAAAGRLARARQVVIVTAHGRPGGLRRAMGAVMRGLGEDASGVRFGAGLFGRSPPAPAASTRGMPPRSARTPREVAAGGASVACVARMPGEGTVRARLFAAAAELDADDRRAAVRTARDLGRARRVGRGVRGQAADLSRA